jgi:hypothetical protein
MVVVPISVPSSQQGGCVARIRRREGGTQACYTAWLTTHQLILGAIAIADFGVASLLYPERLWMLRNPYLTVKRDAL